MAQQVPDPHVDQWVDITDFTPGIYNNSYITGAASIATNKSVYVPAPLGSATAEFTTNCMALANGGLGPLPIAVPETAITRGGITAFPNIYLVGMINTPTTAGTELLLMVEGQNTTQHLFRVWSYIAGTGTFHLVHTVVFTQAAGKGFFCCPYPVMTRMTTRTTATSKPGQPTIVFPWAASTDTHHTSGHLYIYPPVLTPSTYTLQDLIVPTGTAFTSVTGQVIAHQGRVIVLAGIDYLWPRGHFTTNEQVNFTTPSNSSTYKDQREILVPEFPYGYGGAGSISASELFLIKKRGGGVVVTGDINAPYVTFLPGVQPTGDFYGHAGATPSGLFYCADGQGAWFWNGGNTAQKISPQLDDNFFVPRHITPQQNNLRYFAQSWGEWVLFSGGWVYNTRIGSWWRFEDNTYFWYTPEASTDAMYAAYQKITGVSPSIFKLTKSVPVHSWSWKSLPMKLSENKYINVRELVIYVSNPTLTSHSSFTVTITCFLTTGSSNSQSFTTSTFTGSNLPRMFRFPVGLSNVQNVSITIHSNSTNAKDAPILHQISFGIKTRQHVKTQ